MSQPAALPSPITRLGDRVLTNVGVLGEFGLLVAASFRTLRRRGIPLRETLLQFELIAVRSTPIVAITALFTGMVLALQTAFALSRFGAKPYVGSILGLAIVRELGPVLAALMVAGRVGAGITSELGSMKVTEQVDAIRAMGADPVEKLVLPRVIAATVGLPLLTLFAIVLGIYGGLVVADLQYRISPDFFLQTVTTAVTIGDFFSGVIKTFVFGWTIAMVACFVGLRADGGTAGVGRATTQSVVVASIAVLVSDFFLTKLLMLVPTDRILSWIGSALS
ncbi:MAG: ABC transporter permease [Deltaproteobacteria bacterium]|nr:ABC transporter permease [Deltaproteobacteria bacterium]MBW2393171.1 ABC transporter permease [Deltaproteobacteria bacterium]